MLRDAKRSSERQRRKVKVTANKSGHLLLRCLTVHTMLFEVLRTGTELEAESIFGEFCIAGCVGVFAWRPTAHIRGFRLDDTRVVHDRLRERIESGYARRRRGGHAVGAVDAFGCGRALRETGHFGKRRGRDGFQLGSMLVMSLLFDGTLGNHRRNRRCIGRHRPRITGKTDTGDLQWRQIARSRSRGTTFQCRAFLTFCSSASSSRSTCAMCWRRRPRARSARPTSSIDRSTRCSTSCSRSSRAAFKQSAGPLVNAVARTSLLCRGPCLMKSGWRV